MPMPTPPLAPRAPAELPGLLGLPALLRMRASALNAFIVQTHEDPDLAQLCMQMFYVLMALAQDQFALDMQARALQLRRTYRIATTRAPKIRLLAFVGPGNMTDNTPLDMVVDACAVALDLVYVLPDGALPPNVPAHDIAMVAIGESDKNTPLLLGLERQLQDWHCPVLNRPQLVRHCARDVCQALLRDVDGLVYPVTLRIGHYQVPSLDYPYIIRPVDTHGGRGLTRVDSQDALAAYFASFPATAHFVAPFVDYQSGDGQYRKIRLLLLDGQAFVCHLAISSHWMVHYLSAGMAHDAGKRAEEARFMARFTEDFLPRHAPRLLALAQRLGLHYVTVDCAELPDGRLLVFEADSRGLVHASDPVDVYPYKPAVMQRAFDAFEALLTWHAGAGVEQWPAS